MISSVLMTGAEAGQVRAATVARVTNGERAAVLSLSSKVSWRLFETLAWRTVSKGYWSDGVMEQQGVVKSKMVVVGLTKDRSYRVPVAGGLSRLYVSQKETVAWLVWERPSRPGGDPRIRVPGDKGRPLKSPGS
jgi:hypothetical protein